MTQADTLSLAGKVAIVTGSGRENGIGAAIARALARNGAAVTANYVSDGSAPRAEGVASGLRALGARALAVQADVSTPEGAEKLVRETLAGFETDHIDILVNNAGVGTGQGTLATDLTPADMQKSFAGNVFSTLYTSQAVIPHMLPHSRIINIGSVASRLSTLPGVSAYGAAKAAQDYLTGALAHELGRSKGITVNTVAPGGVATDAAGWYPEGGMRDQVGRTLIGMTKLAERPGRPEEVADVVLMLVSELARWVTGQYIAASGGI